MRERLSPWMLLLCAFLLFFIIYLTGAVWPVFISSRGLREGTLGLILGFYGLALFVARLPIGFFCDFLVGNRRTVISGGFLCIAVRLGRGNLGCGPYRTLWEGLRPAGLVLAAP